MAKLIDLNGLAHVYSIIKGMLADKLGKNDTAVNASKVNNLTVETAVPKNAKFTDTVYTHPSTHPSSMITGLSTVATSGSYNDLSDKPTIPSAYTLPNATSSTLGGVKIGSNISVADGIISITKSNVTSALGYTPPTSDTVYGNATTTTAGLMSASDKVKLNNIADNANNYIHPSTHPASMITGLASVATSGSYNDLTDKPTIPSASTVDSELSSTSTNPVQNKVIKEALDGKLGKNETAARATQDGAGNTISTTYAKKTDISGFVKTVNGTAPDSNGNVTITVSGGDGVSTSESNTWTAEQIFNDVTISGLEKSEFVMLNGNSITPTSGYTIWQVKVNSSSSLCTLNLDGLLAKTNDISRFEILLFGNSFEIAPTLKITSTNNDILISCPENTRCSKLYNVIHGMIVAQVVVFIKIDNFTQDGENISP